MPPRNRRHARQHAGRLQLCCVLQHPRKAPNTQLAYVSSSSEWLPPAQCCSSPALLEECHGPPLPLAAGTHLHQIPGAAALASLLPPAVLLTLKTSPSGLDAPFFPIPQLFSPSFANHDWILCVFSLASISKPPLPLIYTLH